MSAEPVRVERFARVFTKGPEELPPDSDSYHDPQRGYYFKLHLDGVASTDAVPIVKSAQRRFEVELVERIRKGGMVKERVYVESPEQVPEGYKVEEGPQGGIYYETQPRGAGRPDDGAETRNVAVIYWDDVELGDDIVYEREDGTETFAEIVDIREREDEADIVRVNVDGEEVLAQPGTYSVENGIERMAKSVDDPWQPYRGPRGGEGWQNIQTGEVVYGEKPGVDGPSDDPEEDFDPAEPPEDGHAEGWTGPPGGPAQVVEGQTIEHYTDGAYHYAEVTEHRGDSVVAEDDVTGEEIELDIGDITAREEIEDPAPETMPDPDEDIPRFQDDELAAELIENTNTNYEDGWTFKRNLEVEDVFDTDAYYVAITGETFEFEEGISKEDVIAFYEEWMDLLEEEPGLRIGGWSFPEDHEKGIAIDLSMAVGDREEAIRLGEELNQQSIANLYREDFPETGGDGEQVVHSKDEVRDVLADVESLVKMVNVRKDMRAIQPDVEYVGADSGERLWGRQIGYIGMNGSRSIEIEDGQVFLDGELFEPVAEKSEGSVTTGTSGVHSARYSPEDEEEVDADLGQPARERIQNADHRSVEDCIWCKNTERLVKPDMLGPDHDVCPHCHEDIEVVDVDTHGDHGVNKTDRRGDFICHHLDATFKATSVLDGDRCPLCGDPVVMRNGSR